MAGYSPLNATATCTNSIFTIVIEGKSWHTRGSARPGKPAAGEPRVAQRDFSGIDESMTVPANRLLPITHSSAGAVAKHGLNVRV
ncbi:hypothetical protein [Caballeronia choica]|uniref:hypothetical protein n=1 Tax=Caballeronia choica TaxID=326476 RepID=UPI000F73619F|nr:hypothetical protein [Caballeronia choica]